MIGTSIGTYRITVKLGAGGMGEVYRATDTKLKRDVALKVLPEAFARDPDRLARFEREAEVLASLNHPNIAAIYGVVEDRALVMELVEGSEPKGPMLFDEAWAVMSQVAAALDYAHEKGVVHRDLKPANIKVTPDGQVKLLDFGLAKAFSNQPDTGANPENSPTLTIGATQVGVILGTAAYMSPEQAKGKQVDKRADIWAFGVVLYELLTGERLFKGEDVSETLAQVLTKEPDLNKVPATARKLLRRCLEKDPKKRLRDVGEAAYLIEDAPTETGSNKSRLPWTAIATGMTLAAVFLGVGWWRAARPAGLKPLVRLDVDLGSDVSLRSVNGTDVILSPNGNQLVFVSKERIFMRRLDQPQAKELIGSVGGYSPFFSPDGQWVAFFAAGKLKKVSVDGGAAITLCDAVVPSGGSWGEDGSIVAALTNVSGLSRIPAAGGAPVTLTEMAQGETSHRWPQILPGGKAVLFTAYHYGAESDEADIDVMTLTDHRRKTLHNGGTFGRYLPTSRHGGYLIYVSQGTLFAVAFDVDKLETRGTPAPVLEQVTYAPGSGAAQLACSLNGTLVYQSGDATDAGLLTVQWLDAMGKMQPILARPGIYGSPRVSPDGSRLALQLWEGQGQGRDVWIYDWQRDTMTRMTFSAGNLNPIWSPDGRYLIYSEGSGIFWTRSDGSGRPQPLIQRKELLFARAFTPDGKRLAFDGVTASLHYHIWTAPIDNEGGKLRAGIPEPFIQSNSDERFEAFSPDGRWLAYASDESGMFQIYVRQFPDRGGKWQISNGGGVLPVWSRNGRELFFRSEDGRTMMVAAYKTQGDSFVADKPRIWSEKPLGLALDNTLVPNYDVASDGKRIVALMPADIPKNQRDQNHVIFLENFLDELRRRVPVSK